MTEVRVDTTEWDAFFARLKAADKSLQTKTRKALRDSVKPMAQKAMEEGAEQMPASGGLAARLATAKPTVTLSARSAAVLLKQKGISLGIVDRLGKVRHPLFGNRRHWFNTMVPLEAFSKALDEHTDEVREAFADALDDVIKEL